MCRRAALCAAVGEVGDTPDVAGLLFPRTTGAFSDITDVGITKLLRWYNVSFPGAWSRKCDQGFSATCWEIRRAASTHLVFAGW